VSAGVFGRLAPTTSWIACIFEARKKTFGKFFPHSPLPDEDEGADKGPHFDTEADKGNQE